MSWNALTSAVQYIPEPSKYIHYSPLFYLIIFKVCFTSVFRSYYVKLFFFLLKPFPNTLLPQHMKKKYWKRTRKMEYIFLLLLSMCKFQVKRSKREMGLIKTLRFSASLSDSHLTSYVSGIEGSDLYNLILVKTRKSNISNEEQLKHKATKEQKGRSK